MSRFQNKLSELVRKFQPKKDEPDPQDHDHNQSSLGDMSTIVNINIENKDLHLIHKCTKTHKKINVANKLDDDKKYDSWFESPNVSETGTSFEHISKDELHSIICTLNNLKGLCLSLDLMNIIYDYYNNIIVGLSYRKNVLSKNNIISDINNKIKTSVKNMFVNDKNKANNNKFTRNDITIGEIFQFFYKMPCNYRVKKNETTKIKVNDIVDPYLFVYDYDRYFEFIPSSVNIKLNYSDDDDKESEADIPKYHVQIINTPLKMYYDQNENKNKGSEYSKMINYFERVLSDMIPQFEDVLETKSILKLKTRSREKNFQFIFKVIQYEMYDKYGYYANLWHFDGIPNEHIKCIGILYTYNTFSNSGELEFTFDKNISPYRHTAGSNYGIESSFGLFGDDNNNNENNKNSKNSQKNNRMEENKQYKASYFAIKSESGTSVVWNNYHLQHRMGFWEEEESSSGSKSNWRENRIAIAIASRHGLKNVHKGLRQAIIIMMIDPQHELKNYDKSDVNLHKISFKQAKERVSKIREKRKGYIKDYSKNKYIAFVGRVNFHLKNVLSHIYHMHDDHDVKIINFLSDVICKYLFRVDQNGNYKIRSIVLRNDGENEEILSKPYCGDCGAQGHVYFGPGGYAPIPFMLG